MNFHFAGAAVAALVLSSPALAVSGNAANGLQAMRETNLIVLGNWQAGQDVEGKTFIGGNASGNSSTLGIGRGNQGATPSARPTLTIGGNNTINGINLNNGANGGNGQVATNPGVRIAGNSAAISSNVQGASIVVGGNLSGNYNIVAGQTFSVGGNVNNGGINGSSGAVANIGGTVNGNVNANGATINQNQGIGFNSALVSGIAQETAVLDADLTALSVSLGNLDLAVNPSSITTLGGRAILNAVDGGNGFALFNIGAGFFSTFSEIQYNFPQTTLPVIINVAGGGTITYNLNPIGNNHLANAQVIWNYTEATTVNFQRLVNGSVLALQAAISNNTPIEGSVVARSFTQNGEVHLGTYGGGSDFLTVPEPGTWVQLIAGFGFAGIAMRRRRMVVVA